LGAFGLARRKRRHRQTGTAAANGRYKNIQAMKKELTDRFAFS